MHIDPKHFWRMTLGEWSCRLDGYYEEIDRQNRQAAWTVSHLLIAAGCDADKVTPAKLLGLPEPRRRRALDEEERKHRDVERLWKRLEKKRGVTHG